MLASMAVWLERLKPPARFTLYRQLAHAALPVEPFRRRSGRPTDAPTDAVSVPTP